MQVLLPETSVVAAWLGGDARRADLVTEEDGPVTILFPGRHNDDHGPDFHDALIANRHGLSAGDIEVHTASSGWWAHRHHLDPAYNRVILHVVYHHDAGRAAVLQNGRRVPTLCLERLTSAERFPMMPVKPDVTAALPCRLAARRLSEQSVTSVLESAGRERFLLKSAAAAADMERDNPDAAAYRAIMAALGYARNREPMLRLACGLSLSQVEQVAAGLSGIDYLQACQAILLGAAGLLPSQRTLRPAGTAGEWSRSLEWLWQKAGSPVVLQESDWHYSRVRPGNYPARRLAAMACLLERCRERGVFATIMASLETLLGSGHRRELEVLFTIAASGEWAENLDVGLPAKGRSPALCGKARAADIIVNAVFPLAGAWYRRAGETEKALALVDAFQRYPGSEENNTLSLLKERLNLSPRQAATAMQRQGLLHIMKTRCSRGGCRSCPFGQV